MANNAPISVPGGPYQVFLGFSLTLDGSGSVDPDGDALIYSWDVNGDGVFGDGSGIAPALSSSAMQSLGIGTAGSRVLRLRVTDTSGVSHTATTSLQVLANSAPTITSNGGAAQSIDVLENVASVTDVDATDPDGHAVSYTIAGGPDATLFSIDALTGALQFIVAPDHEAPTDAGADSIYNLTIRASDTVLWDDQDIIVTVLDAADIVFGTSGNDTIVAGSPGGEYHAGAGDDIVTGSANPDTLWGEAGDDLLSGGFSSDTLVGGDGNDILDGGAGADAMDGGAGNDIYDIDNSLETITDSDGSDTVRTTLTSFALAAGFEHLQYTGGGNFIGVGNADSNIMTGGAGADLLSGGDSIDTLTGGDGNDRLDGGAGNDAMNGGAGDDTYVVDSSLDLIFDSGGIDTVETTRTGYGLAVDLENLTFIGAGAFTGTGNALGNTIIGGAGNDTLFGGEGADLLSGNAGNDGLYGEAGDDTLVGGDGNDTLDGGAGVNTLSGGLGDDTYVVRSTDDSIVADPGGVDRVTAFITMTLPDGIEDLSFGNEAALSATGNAGANTLVGNSQANSLNGGDGDDTLIGGAGADIVNGETGDDTLIVDAVQAGEVLSGGAGTDTLNLFGGVDLSSGTILSVEKLTFFGAERVSGSISVNFNAAQFGGAGISSSFSVVDTWDYSLTIDIAASPGTVFSAAEFGFVGWSVENVFQINGAAGGETLTGSSVADVILGFDGADTLSGGFGADNLFGGEGDDTLDGGAGADTLNGGAGNDIYIADGADSIFDGAGSDTVRTASLTFTLGAALENLIFTGSGNFTAAGNASANVIASNSGDDTLTGGGGADALDGGSGSDTAVFSGNRSSYTIQSLGGAYLVTDLRSGGASDGADTLTNIEFARFADQTVQLAGGSSTIGPDTLNGSPGPDILAGGPGDDTYIVNDRGDVVMETAGEGVDLVQTTLSTFTLPGDVENLTYTGASFFIGIGNMSANLIIGGAANDYFYLYGGDDTALGSNGIDVLLGGAGNDILNGGADQDYLFGDEGNDTLNGDGFVDVLLGGTGGDVMNGGDGGDYFYGEDGNDSGNGGSGNDIFVMGAGDDVANGDDGQDYFYMGDGNDVMNGADGVDVMLGESGSDAFNGGLGVDYMFLGPGGVGDNDAVLVDRNSSGVAVVYNFEAGGANDVIRLSGTGWTTFSQVQAAITDFTASGNFCVLTLDADTNIWLIGIQPSQLTSADFALA